MIFVIASNNKKKIEELERILNPLEIYTKTAEQLGKELPAVEETGATFEENAELKAKAACESTGFPAIADDSGLVIDALGGKPGVFSARYAGEGATDEEKINKIGRCDGTIGYAPRGTNGFGYDPIFFVEGNKTFAELSDNQKDVMSHRGKALKDLSVQLRKKYNIK